MHRPWRWAQTNADGLDIKAEKKGKKSRSQKTSRGPVISATRVSVPTQRLIVAALFGGLQALKLSTAATSRMPALHLVWFAILDVSFVWLVPALGIPWLRFAAWVVLLQTVGLVASDLILFGHARLVWSLVMFGPRLFFGSRHTQTLGSSSSTQSHTNLLGKYVVEFLPESSARLDALGPLCLDTSESSEAYVHLTLDSSWPREIQLAHASFQNDTASHVLTFDARAIDKLPAGQDELWMPVSAPGVYKLSSVIDAETHMSVRIARDSELIVIPPCPKAKLSVGGLPELPPRVCLTDDIRADLHVSGLAPLQVLVDGVWKEVSAGASSAFDVVTASIPLAKPAKDKQFLVTQVVDRLGNIANISELAEFDIVAPATALLAEPGKAWPLLDGYVQPQVTIHGQDPPYTVEYRVNGSRHVAGPDSTVLNASEPGTYELVGLSGSVCSGHAKGSFSVFIPPPVGLSVDFEQVRDKCAGPSGINADLKLEGTPPFKVLYRTLKGNKAVSVQVATIDGESGTVKFKPQSVGTYTYEFVSVEDKWRRLMLDSDEYRQTQIIQELGGASWVIPPPRRQWCANDAVTLDVSIQGKSPLRLVYEVDGVPHTLENLDSRVVSLQLGTLSGGTHHARLISVTDARDCVSELGARSPDIFVRSAQPAVSFKHPGKLQVANAHTKLALRITGDAQPPYRLVYTRNGVRNVVTLASPEFPVTLPGTYELEEFSDSECPGRVESENAVEISLFERPSIEVQTKPDSLCINDPSAPIMLRLTGMPPFVVWHELVSPQGHSEVQERRVEGHEMIVDTPATEAGLWRHWWYITDSNYAEVDRTRGAEVDIAVNTAPDAVWTKPHSRVTVCAGAESDVPGVSVIFKGAPPFTLTIEGYSSTTSKRWRTNVTASSSTAVLRDIFQQAPLGLSTLRLAHVVGGNGCGRDLPLTAEWNLVTIMKTLPPTIGTPLRSHICVGDRVELPIRGSPPFVLEFAFQGRSQRATIEGTSHGNEAVFGRYAAAPGNFTVAAISDASGCRSVAPTSELESPNNDAWPSVEVHELPSSRVLRQEHFSIHHGDTVELAFEFIGIPPFEFTYTRTLNGQILERKTVSNVLEHRHSIFTTEDGIYEVVQLSDAYCHVSNS